MLDWITITASQYLTFYKKFLIKQWDNMGPEAYGVLLISIAVFGYMLMKSGQKAI